MITKLLDYNEIEIAISGEDQEVHLDERRETILSNLIFNDTSDIIELSNDVSYASTCNSLTETNEKELEEVEELERKLIMAPYRAPIKTEEEVDLSIELYRSLSKGINGKTVRVNLFK